MKKIKLEGKLNLNKETVTTLNAAQMKSVKGGAWFTLYHCNRTRNCASANCPPVTNNCPPATDNCVPYTEGGTICQSGCGDLQCP